MRGHTPSAECAGRTGGYGGDDDALACLEGLDGGPDGLDDTDAFVAKDGTMNAGGDVAFQDVEVGAWKE